jgi:sporulation protein YtfJ
MPDGDEHPIQKLMKTAMENLKEMTDVNTIVGDPVETPTGDVILTVSKVGFGFAAGGSQFNAGGGGSDDGGGKLPFGGGSGGGVSITPIAFLIVHSKGEGVETIHLDNTTHLYEKLLNIAPQAVEKIQQMVEGSFKSSGSHFSKGKDKQKKDDKEESKSKGDE